MNNEKIYHRVDLQLVTALCSLYRLGIEIGCFFVHCSTNKKNVLLQNGIVFKPYFVKIL